MALQRFQDHLIGINVGAQIFEEFTALLSEDIPEQNIGILEEPTSGTKTTGLDMLKSGQASTQQPLKSKGGICFAQNEHPEQVDQGTLRYEALEHPPSMIQGKDIAAPMQSSTLLPWLEPVWDVQPNSNIAEQQERARRVQGMLFDAEMKQHNTLMSQFKQQLQKIMQGGKSKHSVWVDDPSQIAPDLSTPPSSVPDNWTSTLQEHTKSNGDPRSNKSAPPPVDPATAPVETMGLMPAMQQPKFTGAAKVDQAGSKATPPSYDALHAFWQANKQPSKLLPDAHG